MDELIRKNIYKATTETTLREFLLLECAFFNRVPIDEFASKERILVDGIICTDLSRSLISDTEVTLLTPQSFEPQVNKDIEILFEDDSVLVVNKPAPLPMHPAGRHYFNTLTSLLVQNDLAKEDALFPVHVQPLCSLIFWKKCRLHHPTFVFSSL